jgi:serine/threonine protein kinase
MHVEDPPPSPRSKRPELSKRLERVIYKLLAKHPDDRYQSGDDLLADLIDVEARVRATQDLGMTPLGTTEMQAMKRPITRTSPWAIAGIVVAALALIALVVKLMR